MSAPKKIAVAGATGRVGRHVVDILEAQGHEVVAMSRSRGVDVITGEGLAEALAGVEAIVDAATGPSPEEQAATEFFTTAARNLQEAGERAGVERIVVVSIIGSDRFAGGYGAAKVAHEQALARRARSRRACCARRSSTSSSRSSWSGARGATSTYVPKMRTQLVAARTVAEALADLATASNGAAPAAQPILEIAGPREESLVEMATLLAARRGDAARIEAASDPDDPDRACTSRAGCCPARTPSSPARRSRQWLDEAGLRHYAASARSASPRRSSAPAIHGSATGSSARSASQRCASSAAVEQARRHAEAQRAPGRRRTPRPRARRRRGARAAASASCAPVLTPCARQRRAQRLEVGVEVEGAATAGGTARRRRRPRSCAAVVTSAVQAAAAGDVLDGRRRARRGRRRRRAASARRGSTRPRWPCPLSAARRVGAERPVGQPAEADPPAAERHALAQPVGDERALGQQRRRGCTNASGS